jgi:hypothetical protein
MPSSPQWLLERLHFFRKYNYFSEYKDLSDDELAALLQERAKGSYWGELKERSGYFEKMPFYPDLILLSFDSKRVWSVPNAERYFKEPDDYYFEGDQLYYRSFYYQNVFLELSKIVFGKFTLKAINAHKPADSQFYCSILNSTERKNN